jgi:hypothetical protein
MSGTDITNNGGGPVGPTGGHFDVREMMKRYLAPFKTAEPFRETLDTINRHEVGIQHVGGCLIALHEGRTPEEKQRAIADALAIREAVDIIGLWGAQDELDDAMAMPPEETVRAIIGVMLSVLRAKPTEGAAIYVDAMVWELMEQETGPICVAGHRCGSEGNMGHQDVRAIH